MREPVVRPISIRNIIFAAKRSLEGQDLIPRRIYTSPDAYESLLIEVNRADKTAHSAILDAYGVPIKIDPDCPSMGAYIVGEEVKE